MSLYDAQIHFEEAKKLENIIFSSQAPSFSIDLNRLKEMNFHLALQRNQARNIFLDIKKSLDPLIAFLLQEKNEERKLKPNFGWIQLTSKKLANLLDILSDLKRQIETEDLTFHKCMKKSSEKLAELSKHLDLLTNKFQSRILKINSLEHLTMKFQNQRKLDDLEQEKREIDFQIRKLQEALRNTRTLQQRLLENILLTDAKLLEIQEIKDENLRKNNSLLNKLSQEIQDTSSQEEGKRILPLQQKEKRLLHALKNPQATTQLQHSGKKIHFIFLVETSKRMKGKLNDIEKSLNTLLKERTSKDLYSLISFNKEVSHSLHKEKIIEPSIEISLPKGENGSSAFSKAIDQAFQIIHTSSFKKHTPILMIITDALSSSFLNQPKPMNERKIGEVCLRLQEYYKEFGEKGLSVFVSYFDPLNRQELKKIARAGNGNKTYFEGSSDNHDFLNNIKDIEKLSKLFQDLDDSVGKSLDLREKEIIQSELDIVQDSIAAKTKLISDISGKERSRVLKEKDLNQETDQMEWNKVLAPFQKIMQEQREDDTRYCKMVLSHSQGILVLENKKQKVVKEISFLEEELQRKNQSEERAIPQHHQSHMILINPENINIHKSINSFRKCGDILIKISSDLLNELKTLMMKLGKIFNQLEKIRERRESGNLASVVRAGIENGMNNFTNQIYPSTSRKESLDKTFYEKDFLSQCLEVQESIVSFLSHFHPS